jgi:hypothetical protein
MLGGGWRAWAAAGSGWSEVWRDTRGEQWLRSTRYLDEDRREWEGAFAG